MFSVSRRTIFAVTLCAGFFVHTGLSARADTLVGSPALTNNVFPFQSYSGEYQQVYASSAFSGPITITGLEFFAARALTSVKGDFTVSLAYSANPVGSLSATYADNIGASLTTFFSGHISESNVPSFTIIGTASFTYDPSLGDILLDVVAANTTGGDPLASQNPSSILQRVFNNGGGPGAGVIVQTGGLETNFKTDVSSVPGPVVGAGLPGLVMAAGAFLAWRRRKQAA